MTIVHYSDPDLEPTRSVGYLVRRAAKLSSVQIEEQFAGCELTLSHWVSLAMMRHGIATNCSHLSRLLGHDSGATTRLVDQLESRGLLERVRDEADRRVVNLAVTADGKAQLAALSPLVFGVWNDVLADFTADEVETLCGLLRRIVANLEARGGE